MAHRAFARTVATRPLVMQKYGQYSMFYTHDGNKNVSELVFFQQANGIAAHYEYAPFGAVTATGRSTPVTAYDFREYNPFRSSSECNYDMLGLIYYNYRHYDIVNGRWMVRDNLWIDSFAVKYSYIFVGNGVMNSIDYIGLACCPMNDPYLESNAKWRLASLELYGNDINGTKVINKFRAVWELNGKVKCLCTTLLGLLSDHVETKDVKKIYRTEAFETLVVLRSVNLPVLSVPTPYNTVSLIGEVASMGWSYILEDMPYARSTDMHLLYQQAFTLSAGFG